MKKQILIVLLLIFIGYPTVKVNGLGDLVESTIKKIELKAESKKKSAARSLSRTKSVLPQTTTGQSQKAALEPQIDAFLQGNMLTIFLNGGFAQEYVTITVRDIYETIIHEERVMVNSAMEVTVLLDNDENGKYLLEIDSSNYYFYGMF